MEDGFSLSFQLTLLLRLDEIEWIDGKKLEKVVEKAVIATSIIICMLGLEPRTPHLVSCG